MIMIVIMIMTIIMIMIITMIIMIITIIIMIITIIIMIMIIIIMIMIKVMTIMIIIPPAGLVTVTGLPGPPVQSSPIPFSQAVYSDVQLCARVKVISFDAD